MSLWCADNSQNVEHLAHLAKTHHDCCRTLFVTAVISFLKTHLWVDRTQRGRLISTNTQRLWRHTDYKHKDATKLKTRRLISTYILPVNTKSLNKERRLIGWLNSFLVSERCLVVHILKVDCTVRTRVPPRQRVPEECGFRMFKEIVKIEKFRDTNYLNDAWIDKTEGISKVWVGYTHSGTKTHCSRNVYLE